MAPKFFKKLSSIARSGGQDRYLYNDYGDYRESSLSSSPPLDQPLQKSYSRTSSSGAVAAGTTFRNVAYFCSWSIYARDHFPEDLPVNSLTHVIYAFLNVNPETGAVILDDEWASTGVNATRAGKQQSGDGIFGELYRLKQLNRNLKVLVSLGGWTYSTSMKAVMINAQKRQTAVESLISLVKRYNFDGVDLDWEYPETTQMARYYVSFVVDLRSALNSLASELQIHESQFEISVAAPAGPEQCQILDISAMTRFVDFWNLMTYDFAGAWSETVGHHSNLYHGYISVSSTVDYYLQQGARRDQIVVGIPLYGRSFAGTNGLDDTFRGVGKGTWEDGIVDYKKLPLPNTREQVDSTSVGAFCYDPGHKCFVSYDNPETVRIKSEFIRDMQLGGAMWWESSADLPITNPRSLISKYSRVIGGRLAVKANYLGR